MNSSNHSNKPTAPSSNAPIQDTLPPVVSKKSTIPPLYQGAIVLLFIITIGALLYLFIPSSKNSDKALFWQDLPDNLFKQKEQMSLPKRVDEYTTLNDMYVENNTIVYLYNINDIVSLDESQQSYLRQNVKAESFIPYFCKQRSPQKYGLKVTYKYYIQSSAFSFTFSASDCPN